MKALNPILLSLTSLMLASSSFAVDPIVPNILPSKLTPNSIESATKAWQRSGMALPVKNNNGVILYPFSESVPTITCSPLHVCDIELQAGEKIMNVAIGDQVRWLLSPASSGDGNAIIPHVIVKPTDENVSTNMVVTTDKRTYYLFLTSKKTEYITRISFYYPQDLVENWNNNAKLAKEHEQNKIAEFPSLTAENLNFNYDISGSNNLIKPIRVFNDGKHVYMQMAKELSSLEAPILMVIGKGGESQLVNYRMKSGYYIVDRLFERAELILGVGKAQEKIKISVKKAPTCFYNCN
jgi:type IV secretion system protein VirB9